MISVQKNRYQRLEPEEATMFVVATEQNIYEQELGFLDAKDFILSLAQPIDGRTKSGSALNPHSREAVTSLIRASIPGYDHIYPLSRELCRLAVTPAQTTPQILDQVRSSTVVNESTEAIS